MVETYSMGVPISEYRCNICGVGDEPCVHLGGTKYMGHELGPTNADTLEKIQAIYASEQNMAIESFFDKGWTFKLGDWANGFTAEKNFKSFPEGVGWAYNKVFGDTND